MVTHTTTETVGLATYHSTQRSAASRALHDQHEQIVNMFQSDLFREVIGNSVCITGLVLSGLRVFFHMKVMVISVRTE